MDALGAREPAPGIVSRWAELRDDISKVNGMTPAIIDREVEAIPHDAAMEQWRAECERLKGECLLRFMAASHCSH